MTYYLLYLHITCCNDILLLFFMLKYFLSCFFLYNYLLRFNSLCWNTCWIDSFSRNTCWNLIIYVYAWCYIYVFPVFSATFTWKLQAWEINLSVSLLLFQVLTVVEKALFSVFLGVCGHLYLATLSNLVLVLILTRKSFMSPSDHIQLSEHFVTS